VEEAAAEWLGREGVDVRSVSCVTGHGMDAVIEAVQRSVEKATGASSSAVRNSRVWGCVGGRVWVCAVCVCVYVLQRLAALLAALQALLGVGVACM
jgi:hypothetical protein